MRFGSSPSPLGSTSPESVRAVGRTGPSGSGVYSLGRISRDTMAMATSPTPSDTPTRGRSGTPRPPRNALTASVGTRTASCESRRRAPGAMAMAAV